MCEGNVYGHFTYPWSSIVAVSGFDLTCPEFPGVTYTQIAPIFFFEVLTCSDSRLIILTNAVNSFWATFVVSEIQIKISRWLEFLLKSWAKTFRFKWLQRTRESFLSSKIEHTGSMKCPKSEYVLGFDVRRMVQYLEHEMYGNYVLSGFTPQVRN